MKRQRPDTESLVYAYACSTPLSGAEHLVAERERIRALWNRLVDIDRATEHAITKAAGADVPALQLRLMDMARLTAQLRDPATNRTAARQIVTERRAIERETWPYLTAWRRANKPRCDEIEATRRASVTEARQESRAYWGNYNNTIGDYEIARRTVRQFGRRLRYQDEGRDDGCLTVQIQRTRSGLGASPAELQDGSFAAVQIAAVDPRAHDPAVFRGDRRKLARTRLQMRVDAAGHMVTVPLVLHRALPEDARIKSVQLTWQARPGYRLRWRACFTISRPATDLPAEGAGAAQVILGWQERNGALVIATGPSELALPRVWMAGMDRVARLQGAIDAAFTELGPRD